MVESTRVGAYRQVGAYRLLQQIGEGGMGSVWLAEHIALGRRAALKMLHPEFSNQTDIVTRFFNEARAATAIADPGIVQVFDFGQHDGRAYIVMELLDGEPLDRRLKREGALTLVDGLRLMRQVASTLGAAHARGIIHRDLKPENIYIIRDPEVPGGERTKVLDFGIAKLTGDQAGVKTATAAVMGTPTFMSPEQCRGAGHVDQRSDVYALGCVLFTLVVGRPPFNAEGIGDIIAMHLREPAPAPSQLHPGLPPEFDQLVLRCLAKDPVERFQTASELASAIGGLLGSSPQIPAARTSGYTTATAPTTLSSVTGARGISSAKRSRVSLIAAIGGLGTVGLVIAMVVTRSGDQRALAPAPLPALVAHRPSTPAPLPTPAADRPPAPASAPLSAPSDSSARVAQVIKDALTRFVEWSHDNPGAPCPDAAVLGVTDDPWGHPLAMTCMDQPGNQIIGAVSAGPDGQRGTADDITSWQLGRDVTDLVPGTRWLVVSQKPTAKPVVLVKPRSRPAALTPAKPDVPTKPAGADVLTRSTPAVEFDDNGLPITR